MAVNLPEDLNLLDAMLCRCTSNLILDCKNNEFKLTFYDGEPYMYVYITQFLQ